MNICKNIITVWDIFYQSFLSKFWIEYHNLKIPGDIFHRLNFEKPFIVIVGKHFEIKLYFTIYTYDR